METCFITDVPSSSGEGTRWCCAFCFAPFCCYSYISYSRWASLLGVSSTHLPPQRLGATGRSAEGWGYREAQAWLFSRGGCTDRPASSAGRNQPSWGGTHTHTHVRTRHTGSVRGLCPAQHTLVGAAPHHLRAEKLRAYRTLNFHSAKSAEMLL